MISKKITGEYSLQSDLVDLLISKGYPDDSFFVDFEIEGVIYSFVVKDPVSKNILAIYEYDIVSPVVVTSAGIRKALEKYSSLNINPKVHLYILHGIQGGTSYSISKILYQTKNSYSPLHTNIEEIIDFLELKKKVLTNDNEKSANEKPNDLISKLKQKISQIDKLKSATPWGAEYKLWDDGTKNLIKKIFGSKGLDLFERQQTVVISDEGYGNELSERKLLLEGMLSNQEDYNSAEIIEDFKPDKTHETRPPDKQINWTKWGTILAGLSIFVAIIIWQFPKPSKEEQVENSLKTEKATISPQKDLFNNGLRPLLPLETGKSLGSLPDKTYFYSDAVTLAYEIRNPAKGYLKAKSDYTPRYSFEIQKVDSRYYVIGFVSDELYSRIGEVSEKNSLYLILSPYKWGGATNAVAIPFDKVYTAEQRTINLDESSSMSVLDIGFREAKANAVSHQK